MKIINLVLGFSIFAFGSAFAHTTITPSSSTIVRNGGDALLAQLRQSSQALGKTAEFLLSSKTSIHCDGPTTDGSQEKCRDLLKQTAPQLLKLIKNREVDFILTEEILRVKSEGRLQTVSARTALGPAGAIEFNRKALQTLSSSTVMFLLAHEYMHKILLDGKYLEDDEVAAPFSDGRDLIDTLARTLARIAAEQGYLAIESDIRDIFSCTVSNDGIKSTAKLSTPRRRVSNLDITETSFGLKSLDAAFATTDKNNVTWDLLFLITSREECADESAIFKLPKVIQISHREKIVARQELEFNPLCSDKAFGISFEKIQFTCQFLGSENNTKGKTAN
jgi:hypothetical protein